MLNFQLPEQIVMIIMRSLGKQPHDEVRGAIDELVRQINSQKRPLDEAAE